MIPTAHHLLRPESFDSDLTPDETGTSGWTKGPPMDRGLKARSKMGRFVRTTMGVIAATAGTAMMAMPAAAAPQGYVEQDVPAGLFYGNFELDVLLFTGGGVEEICLDAPEPMVPARIFERNDGSVDVNVNAEEVPFVLYSSELGAPEFIGQTCEALFDDDPSTVPPQPFASGTGKVKVRVSSSPDGVDEIVNGVNGFATGADGTTWKVRTWADFVVDNGVLIGDPAEFQGLSIQQIGPGPSSP